MIQLFKSAKPTTRYLIILLMLGIAVFSIWKVFMTEQTYRYQVLTSSPNGYEGLIESTNSYLMDKKARLLPVLAVLEILVTGVVAYKVLP